MSMTRQLTAIMFTNIEGYSALMQKDESRALELRERHRKVFHSITEKFHGKVLQYHGDGTLSIFASAVEAVLCAKEMQLDFQNELVIPVRIGIHQGDIIYSNDEVIGDGVNVASMIECKAIPGSILISSKVHDEVKNQSEIEAKFLNSCQFEGIEKPIDVYAISNSGLVVPDLPAAKGEIVFQKQKSRNKLLTFWNELKRRKVVRVMTVYAAASYVILEVTSIIVEPLHLPDWTLIMVIILLCIGFVFTSVLSWVYDITPDGIKVTQPLKSDIDNLIAKSYKGSWFKKHKILKRYLFPLIVFAGLYCIFHYWDNIFGNREKNTETEVARFHTESAISIIKNSGNLEVAKTELELALSADPSFASALNTYAMIHLAEEDTVEAKKKLQLTLELDPTFSTAWNSLATFAFWQDSIELALSYTIKAVQYDLTNYVAAYNMAVQSEKRGFHIQALKWYNRAISMDSSFADAYSALGALYNDLNRPIDAILILQESLKISPLSEQNYRIYKNLAESHFLLKEYDKALSYLDQSKTQNPDYPETEKCFARLYEARGEADQSIQHWNKYIEMETDSVNIQEALSHLDSIQTMDP